MLLYSLRRMRRVSAILLFVVLVGVPVLSELAATTVPSDIPACCKKGGAHMCSVRRGQVSQKDGQSRLNAVCPFAAKSTLAVVSQRVGIAVGDSSASVLAPVNRASVTSQVFVPPSASRFENPKRGPPPSHL